jgi:transketolase
MGASLGLALAAADIYGAAAPRVHIIEGEGGLTPGRVSEALAFAGTASLGNAIVHVDWNQASIDSERVTREGSAPGDYVQWDPMELFHLHDWNVVQVPDGFDFRQVLGALRLALSLDNGQPTAVVYRTTKGWRYGIEGRASHGAGHPLCSAGYYEALWPLIQRAGVDVPHCEPGRTRCANGTVRGQVEECYWDALQLIRRVLEASPEATSLLAGRVLAARDRLDARARRPRPEAPVLDAAFAAARRALPPELVPAPGTRITLRSQLGRLLGHLNQASGGALLVAAADLLGSTSVAEAAKGFDAGYFNVERNRGSRTLSMGGIAEDAMTGVLSGVSSFGVHMGVGSSYAAFLAPLGHVAARLHAIGNQARRSRDGGPYRPVVLVCGHAGLKTGEDGPTHADPQPLQLLQGNFPPGTMVTLTPWEPTEIWPALAAALEARPAVIAPFVTRPTEVVPDRAGLGLAPAADARTGVYRLLAASGPRQGTVVLQGSDVALAFVQDALPRLRKAGIEIDVYYVASAELFDALPIRVRRQVFPRAAGREAMGITGFTLPTMYRWIMSDLGRRFTLHPYRKGHYLGSGPGDMVLAEAGLDGRSQFRGIVRYVRARRRRGLASRVPELP